MFSYCLAMMGIYGIQMQTQHEVEPVQIWPPSLLVIVYEHLGLSKQVELKENFPADSQNFFRILKYKCFLFYSLSTFKTIITFTLLRLCILLHLS